MERLPTDRTRDVGDSPAAGPPAGEGLGQATATVAVIVPTFRRADSLQALLDSLAGSSLRPDEVIVVDNDPDGSVQVGDERNFPVKVITAGLGLSLAGARNVGWRNSASDVCVFVDDDITFGEHALDRLTAACQEEAIGLAGPVIYDGTTGRILVAGIARSEWTGRTRLLLRESSTLPDTPRWPTADMPAAFALRRTLLQELGGMDEVTFPIHYDEADLGIRIKSLGKEIVVLRDARVLHFGGYTNEQPGDTMIRYARQHGTRRVEVTVRSRVRFHKLHSHGAARVTTLGVFIPLWTVGIVLSCVRAKVHRSIKRTTIAAVLRGLVEGYLG